MPDYLPNHDEERKISRLLPNWKTACEYIALCALESNDIGSLAYDSHKDEVIYHHVLSDLDRDLFDILHGVEEVWVITGANRES